MLTRHPVGTEDHKDIIDVLEAVHEIGRGRPREPEAPNKEAATPAAVPTQRPSTTESPSTSTAPAGRCSRPPVPTFRLSLPSIPLHPMPLESGYQSVC